MILVQRFSVLEDQNASSTSKLAEVPEIDEELEQASLLIEEIKITAIHQVFQTHR